MENLIKIIKALSDVNRLKIVAMLRKKALCVCEIEALLPLAQPTISTHLKVLVNAKLIKYEKQGTWVIYHLVLDNFHNELKQVVIALLDVVDTTPEVITLLKRQKTVNARLKCK